MASLKTAIMEDFSHTYASMKFEMQKHRKRKRIVIGLLLATAVPVLFYIIPKLWDVPFMGAPGLFLSTNLSFVNILIIISSALFAGDAVSGEFERKTALLTFPTPQRRISIFVGKYCAALIAITGLVSLYYLITMVEVMVIYGINSMPHQLFTSYLLALLYGCSVLSLTFFFSSILRGVVSSTLMGFVTLIWILPVLSMLLVVARVEPWFIVTYTRGLITTVFGAPVGTGMTPPERMMFTLYQPDFTIGVAVMAVYALLFFISSIVLANRKDVE